MFGLTFASENNFLTLEFVTNSGVVVANCSEVIVQRSFNGMKGAVYPEVL
jgi:hypothetical protein